MNIAFLSMTGLLVAATSGARDVSVCVASGAPFFYEQGGIPTGIEYDILKGFAEEQGIALTFNPVHLRDVLDGVEHGECDLAAARMSPNESRMERVDFSESYFPVRVAIVQRRDRLVTSVDELAGKTLGVTAASSFEDLVAKVPGVKLFSRDANRNAAEMTVDGTIDGLAIDSVFVGLVTRHYPELRISVFLPDPAGFAFPVRRGSELKASLDAYIRRLKTNGGERVVLARYFDTETIDLLLGGDN